MADDVYRGTVTRVTTLGAFLTIPELGVGVEYGPAPLLRPARASGTAGETTGPASAGTAHTHTLGHALTAGDRVLVTTVRGVRDDLVILGRL